MNRIFAPLWQQETHSGNTHAWFGLAEVPDVYVSIQNMEHHGPAVWDWRLLDLSQPAGKALLDRGRVSSSVDAKIAAETALWHHLTAHQRVAVTKRLAATKR